MNKPNLKSVRIVAIILMVALVSSLITYQVAIRASFEGSQESLPFYVGAPQPYSYIIDTNGTHYFAYNGTTGFLEQTSTNASVVINNAIGNGTFTFIKAGTYSITAKIQVPSSATIEGEARSTISGTPVGGTILSLEYDGNVFESSGNPSQAVRIAHLTIDGNRGARTLGTAIYGKFRNSVFEDLYIMDMDESGIVIEDTTNTVDCWDNYIVNCHIWWVDEYGLKFGTRGTDQVVIGGHIAYAGQTGIYLDGAGGHRFTDTVLSLSQYAIQSVGGSFRAVGLNIEQTGKHSIYLQATAARTMEMVTISSCRIMAAGTEADNTYSAIYVEGYGTGDSTAARNIIITSNVFFKYGAGAGQTKYCVAFAGVNERDITVVGNDMRWGYQTAPYNLVPTSSQFGGNDVPLSFKTDNLVSVATYTIETSGGYYWATHSNGTVFWYGTNASQVANFADKKMTGGTIFFKHGTYLLDTPIYPSDYNQFIGEDDNTILSMTTPNSAVFHISAGINNVHIENMRIQNSSAGTNCTGIRLDGNYHKIMNVWLDNLAYGMVLYQSGSACDNWYSGIYIIGFKDTGLYIVKMHDSLWSDITIGTSAAATAAIRWDEGGSGCHFTNIHIWGSATLTYGIWLGSGSGVYQYDASWDSVEIEDSGIQLGLYIQASANYNHFNNLWFKVVINASVIIGDYNTFTGINLRAVGDYGLIIQTAALNINGGYITGTGKTAIFISTAYLEYKAVHISNLNIYNSGTDTANTYADIDVYHTKYIQLSGINTQGTNVIGSINFTDCTNGMLQNSWTFDKPILTSGTSTSVEIHTSYNITSYIT